MSDDLISRQEAIDLVESFYKIDKSVLDIMVFKFKQLPTIEAVDVVHCKDCKWFGEFCDEYKQESRKDGMCEHPKLERYTLDTTFDFFCADGDRRDPCSSQDS